MIFFGVFEKFETFFSKICTLVLIASGTEILLAGIFEILTFYGNITFPLSPVLYQVYNLAFFVDWRYQSPTKHKTTYS